MAKEPFESCDPTPDEVRVQVQLLCAHEFLQGEERPHLLKFLVRLKLEDRYKGPFTDDNGEKPKPSGRRIGFEYYRHRATRTVGGAVPTWETYNESAAKRLFPGLIRAVEAYYGPRGPDQKGFIRIRIPTGRGRGYEPSFEWLQEPPDGRTSSVIGNLEEAREGRHSSTDEQCEPAATTMVVAKSYDTVRCEYLGNSTVAMNYLLGKYEHAHTSSPRLMGVRETHTRAESPAVLFRQGYDDFRSLRPLLSDFLNKCPGHTIPVTVILGRTVDRGYVEELQAALKAVKGYDKKVRCQRFKSNGFVMNFVILEYSDHTSEVLFGWGPGPSGYREAVFSSKDHRLVAEFTNFYEALLKASDRIDVDSLVEPLPE